MVTVIENANAPEDPFRRAIERFGLLQTVVKSSPAQRIIQAVRGARTVKEPVEFVARQFGPTRRAPYHLRRSDQVAIIRHRSRDVHMMNEIFGGTGGRLAYEPPSALRPVLDRNPAPKILDLGGNIGMFGLYALHRWPGGTVRSFEPDADSAVCWVPRSPRIASRSAGRLRLRRWATTRARWRSVAGCPPTRISSMSKSARVPSPSRAT